MKLACVREQEDARHPKSFPVKSETRSELMPDRVPRGNQPARRFLPPSPVLGFPSELPHCQQQCTAEDKFVWFPSTRALPASLKLTLQEEIDLQDPGASQREVKADTSVQC